MLVELARSLELRGLRAPRLKDAAHRVARHVYVRMLMESTPSEVRKALEAVLDGPITFTPVETDAGPRYRIEGRLLVGHLIRSDGVPSGIFSERSTGDGSADDADRSGGVPCGILTERLASWTLPISVAC